MAKYSRLATRQGDSTAIEMVDEFRIGSAGKNDLGIVGWLVFLLVCMLWIVTLPATWWLSFKVVSQYERIVVFRLGKLLPVKGPGLVFIIPVVDKWILTDMRMRAFSVPPHQIMTTDGCEIKVGADVQYRIIDPVRAYALVQNLDHTLRLSAHSVLNNTLAPRKAADIPGEKSLLGVSLQNSMNMIANGWGIEIARFEITQVLCRSEGTSARDEDFQDPLLTIVNVVKGLVQATGSSHGDTFAVPTVLPPNPSSVQPSSTKANSKALLTPSEFFEMLTNAVDQNIADAINASFFWDISGEKGGQWLLDLRKNPYIVARVSQAEDVDVSFRLSDQLFTDILYHKISISDAYFGGQLIVHGSLPTAMKIETLVRSIQRGA